MCRIKFGCTIFFLNILENFLSPDEHDTRTIIVQKSKSVIHIVHVSHFTVLNEESNCTAVEYFFQKSVFFHFL